MILSRVDGPDNLFVGGLFGLYRPEQLTEHGITHVLSVIDFSLERWGDEAEKFTHMSIDIDDMEDEDLLVHFPSLVRFIDRGLHPGSQGDDKEGETSVDSPKSPGSVFVHCAMGKSRSVSAIISYLLYKYPHRYGGKENMSWAERRATAGTAVASALKWVRNTRSLAEPNSGFMRQLEMWWEMGCPADDDRAVENHPMYQKWLYDRRLAEARDAYIAPELEWIRFEDEAQGEQGSQVPGTDAPSSKAPEGDVRCKKCRRVLATAKFIVAHHGTGEIANPAQACPHVFVETLSWMRSALEGGALDGRLVCPNAKCGAVVGRFAWQGFKCSCGEWVCPAFSLNRSRVDEVIPRQVADSAIRQPPGFKESL